MSGKNQIDMTFYDDALDGEHCESNDSISLDSYRTTKVRDLETTEREKTKIKKEIYELNRNNNSTGITTHIHQMVLNGEHASKRIKDKLFEQSDIVLVSPIRANFLNVKRVCENCTKRTFFIEDCDFYAGIIQTFLGIIVLGILSFNVLKVYKHFQNCDDDYECFLEICHIICIIISLIFINLLTLLFSLHDFKQSEKGGYRLRDEFFMLLWWSGGWMIGWILFFTRKLSENLQGIMIKYGILLSFGSFVSIGSCYVYFKSKFY
ncbi:unnamed protein product [Brachionus calyciflorus]|uniref:Uncharacterized protein n=1 Tax=Brachionus calyciflorus TaxID=104777 RepID=A0A813Y188_9BILA|nr:unnamed protein product [Brachionus calyciflorus]